MLDAANGIGKEDAWPATRSRQLRLSLFKALAKGDPRYKRLLRGLAGLDPPKEVRSLLAKRVSDYYEMMTKVRWEEIFKAMALSSKPGG
jgi:hypothetical protein